MRECLCTRDPLLHHVLVTARGHATARPSLGRAGFLKHFLRSEYGTLRLSPANMAGAAETAAYIARLNAFLSHTRQWAAPWTANPAAVDVFLAAVGLSLVVAPRAAASTTAPKPSSKPSFAARVKATFLAQWAHAGFALLLTWLLYVAVFHYLANLPVDAAMPLGVLSRFWMQPDIITAVAIGRGLSLAVGALLGIIDGPGA